MSIEDLSLSEVETAPDASCADEALLRRIHHVLFDVHIIEGRVLCPETGRVFPINEGIPNMLLHEDEI